MQIPFGLQQRSMQVLNSYLFSSFSTQDQSKSEYMDPMNETDVNLQPTEKQQHHGQNQTSTYFMGVPPIEQLQLRVDPKNEEDIQELNMILEQILSYPSTDMAEIHKEANRLGNHDIRREQSDMKSVKTQQEDQMSEGAIYCSCCGFIKQEDPVKICTPLKDINNIGISTFLYFQTIKNLGILLTLMLLIYCIYSLATNILAANRGDPTNVNSYIPADILAISLGPKQSFQTDTNRTYYYIQCWIGLALMIVWLITIIILKYLEKANEVRVEQQTISASDFSIVIEYMPTELTKDDVQKQFNQYFATITNVPESKRRPLIIKKYNVGKPFYLSQADLRDQQVDQIRKESQNMLEMFIQWIYERQNSPTFSSTKQFRQEQYKRYDQLCKRKQKKMAELLDKVKEQFKKENPNEVTTVFITLQTSHARALIAGQNSEQLSNKIRYYLTCCQTENRFKAVTRDGQSHSVKIMRAPEPEDVIWTNLGVSERVLITRKIITYVVTIILLGISFAAVYGLSVAQVQNSDNRVLSVVISVLISLINIILGQVIRRLTIFERDYTETKHQTSLGIKSVMAQLINSILVPIFANWFIKGNNLYEANGLAEDVFYLGITNAVLAPVLKIFDGYYIFTRLIAWFNKRISRKMWLDQPDLNQSNELIFFEVGYEYIYIVNLFLFTCFFVSLQPIIVVFSLCGYFLMYWAQKYCVFNRMKRPVPGTDLINVALWQLIFLGGILYALGSLCWSNFFPRGIPAEALIPNLISLAFGILLFLFPFSSVFACIFSNQSEKVLDYDDHRIYLAAEYDRLNPSTSEQGFKDYMNYVEKIKEKMKNASKQEQERMAKKFLNQNRRGSQRIAQFGPGFGEQALVGGLAAGFGGQSFFRPPQQQRFNPMLIGQHIIPQTIHMPPQVVPFGAPQMQMPIMRPPQQQFGPQQHQMRPNPPPGFNQGPPGFNQGPPGFNQGPPGFNQGPPGFNQGLQMQQQRPPVFQQQAPPKYGFQQQAPPRYGFQQQAPPIFGFQQGPQQPFGFGAPQQPFGFPQQGGFGFR